MTSGHANSSRLVVYAALLGNLAVAVVKFIAAAVTGSSAMLSEGVHSLVDTGNEVLLLFGMRRAARPADESHPFGYGREVYFWSFIVALLVFALGAGVSLYEGVQHILKPEPIQRPIVNYVVLLAAMAFEGASWWVAWREFKRVRGEVDTLQAVRDSKDPTTFVVLFEDSAALVGLLMALSAVGIDLTALSVLGGAIGVGIGAAAIRVVGFCPSKGMVTAPKSPIRTEASEFQASLVQWTRCCGPMFSPTDERPK